LAAFPEDQAQAEKAVSSMRRRIEALRAGVSRP
jgi:hypothetical protein